MRFRTLLCLIGLLLTACGSALPNSSPDAAPPEPSAEPTDRPTSVALPPTWTPTITRTPTFTPTITLTRTETPIVTPQPTQERTPIPTSKAGEVASLASAVILASDLPPGYQPIPVEEYLLTAFLPDEQQIKIVRLTGYASLSENAALMSMTFVFENEEEMTKFDDGLRFVPERFDELDLEDYLSVETGMDIDLDLIQNFPALGNISLAFRIILSIEDSIIEYEIVMFRRNTVGAVVAVFTLGEDGQAPDLYELASLLDQRIIMTFEDTP